jgi:sugar lactone lactonase YvrE
VRVLSPVLTAVTVIASLLASMATVRAAVSPAPASAVAQVRYIYRGLGVQPPHQGRRSGKMHDPLYNQYGLQTQSNQKASIGFTDGTVLHLNQDTDAILSSPHQTTVKSGEVAEYLAAGTNHRVQTPAAVASAIGTTYNVEVVGNTTTFVVLHGALQVANAKGAVVVKSNHQSTVVTNQAPEPPVPADAKAVFAWTAGIPTPDLGEDVALDANGGQVLSESSQREGPGDSGHASHIDDGSLSQGWQSAQGKTSNQSVTVGFLGGNFYRISDVIIDPAATGGDRASEDLKDFAIKVSSTTTDPASFTTVYQGTCKQEAGLQHFTLPVPVRAKYVQLEALSNYGSPDRVAVAEWEVVATASLFAQPSGIAVDSAGKVYVADTNSDRIDKLSSTGKMLAHWGSKGTRPGQFLRPTGVAIGPSGDIYVTDTGNARVEQFSSRGKFLTAWGTSGMSAGQFEFPRGIAVDSLGNVYVSDVSASLVGGLQWFIRIQKFSSSGKLLADWDNLVDAGQVPVAGGLTFDRQGNLLVADTGANDVVQVSSAGKVLRTYGGYGSAPGRFNQPADVAVDASGAIYVVDSDNYRIQRIASTGMVTTWGTAGYGKGQFVLPQGIATDKQGNLLVSDSFNSRIQKLSPVNGKIRAVWGKYATVPNVLGEPAGVAVDPNGFVYITDSVNDRLQVRSPNGRVAAIIGYHGNVHLEKNTKGLGQFWYPHGIAIDAKGEIYVADSLNCRIQLLAPRGPIGTFGTCGKALGHFSAPWGVAVDRKGNIYVADTGNNRVQKLSPSGSVLWSVGTHGTGPRQFGFPTGIAVDSKGNVYVSNLTQDVNTGAPDGRIEKLSAQGKVLAVWGQPDPLGLSRFAAPAGMAVDAHDNLYVADSGHNVIQKLSPDGKVLFVYALPGPNANPVDVAVDKHGNLYVADHLNDRVVKLAPTGEVLAIWR